MRKTIFSQILTAQFTIVTLCVSVLASLLFTFVGQYIVDEREQLLKEEVTHLNEITVFYQENQNSNMASLYAMTLNDIARRMGGVVFIADRNGKIRTCSQNIREHIESDLPEEQVSRLFAGDNRMLGNLNGFFKKTYLLVSSPISYRGKTHAVGCIAVPMPEITRYRNDIFRTVAVSTVCTAMISFLLAYFLSRRISSPLKHISSAAKSIAKGNFDVEVPVRGNTEIAELSETFNQMTFSLKKLEDMRDGFISNVSHELRTPMTTISGFVEGILDGTVPADKQTEYLSIVLNETKRLARLVNELLLVARMEGGLVLQKTVFDINELCRVALLRFEQSYADKNICAKVDFASDVCLVLADKDAIDRVLINLFDNAAKFNIPGGYVHVKVSETDTVATISVENTGPGLTSEELKMIWDKFYKTDKSRSLDKTGVGLGLYLVKNIVAAHGEKIYAESVPDRFTRFVFTLKKR